jgi:hypothetical protein
MKRSLSLVVGIAVGAVLIAAIGASANIGGTTLSSLIGVHHSQLGDKASGARTESPEPTGSPEAARAPEPTEKPKATHTPEPAEMPETSPSSETSEENEGPSSSNNAEHHGPAPTVSTVKHETEKSTH